MAESSIEWTDRTWNPVSGCTRASAGCDNCYAVKMTKRLEAMGQDKYAGLVNLGKNHFNGVVKCHEDALLIPWRWKKPVRIFVNSMSDLFHKDVPFEFIDKVFAVMALCPQHTFQILTKRPERMAEYFAKSHMSIGQGVWCDVAWAIGNLSLDVEDKDFQRVIDKAGPIDTGSNWPLPNVWIGTSVEDQKTADNRIPHLLRCPAAVRFLSCEPLLGDVDLMGWAPNDAHQLDMPATWGEFSWPDWIPERVRRLIVDFWVDKHGREPSQWARDNAIQKTPMTGAIVEYGEGNMPWVLPWGPKQSVGGGRWFHRWNNMGSIVTDDGKVLCASASQGRYFLGKWLQDGQYKPLIHWVICGGESGPGARPMSPAWARSLRDQCQAAGVPFFFKQWGMWVTEDQSPEDIVLPSESFALLATWDEKKFEYVGDLTQFYKVGKGKAGRLLDGQEWSQFPEVAR